MNVEPIIKEKLTTPVSKDHYHELKRSLENACFVMYFADNSGEVVFDRVLVEILAEENGLEVIYVVRSVPTLTDVTLREVRLVGIDEVATVMENGIDGPLPGTILSRCSEEVRRLVREADLVISKGGGNFDTLDEEKILLEKTFFLLMCKCIPYCNIFGTDMH